MTAFRAVLARAGIAAALVLAALAPVQGCGARASGEPTTLRFWAMGREGEVVQELVRDFERENPGVRVRVQQIPWSAAHEKLLTAHVGGATPDLAQLGNTWISEFVALRAIEPLDRWLASSASVDSSGYFPGIWDTNVVDGSVFGVPWYVDTRVLFYRRDLLERAGVVRMPETWREWRAAMEAVKRTRPDGSYAIFLPTNEFMQPVILGMQAGSPLLTGDGTRGAFRDSAFQAAFDFYLDLFRDGLAPTVGNNEIANLYQEFARGTFAMYITGPWNLGEFRRRLPPELQSSWSTAALPGPTGPASGVSVAGGSSLVLMRASRHKPEAWRLIEFLSRPEQQVRFYRLTGDLPARREAWQDTSLTRDPVARAFWEQLQRVRSTPKVPEWELVATRLLEKADLAIRGRVHADSALATLDREVDRILEKRRWLLERRQAAGVPGGSP
ncbi:MAG TPA: sugar ABC transporter substrate-binding protein [Candidatus Limnocylindria bacterium]|nr:sugar ABC transporter substrate-binding protein [Candidatus Limnocylindria bacterium]